MIKKIILSFFKTFKDFLVMVIAQIIAAIIFFAISFFLLKYLDLNLSSLADENKIILFILIFFYLIFAGFIANLITKNRKGKKPF